MKRLIGIAIFSIFVGAHARAQTDAPAPETPPASASVPATNVVVAPPVEPAPAAATPAATNAPAAVPSTPTEPPAVQPLASLTVGSKTFENVTLTGFDGKSVTFSHAAGIKTVPLLALSTEQVEALNRSADKVSIKAEGVDLTPPPAESITEAETMIQSAGGVDGLLPNGNTPLVEAVATQRADLVKALVARGANPNLESKSGKTPLGVAEGWGDPALIQLVKTAGAEPKVEVKAIEKSPRMIELEKRLAEFEPKIREAKAEQRKHADKANSLKSQARTVAKRRVTNTDEEWKRKAQVDQINSQARGQEALAENAAARIRELENARARTQQDIAQERGRLLQAMETERRQEAERAAREQEIFARSSEQPPPMPAPSRSDGSMQTPPGVDPGMKEMQRQMGQARANMQTVQSMMDIMESKTAAEKEVERIAKERQEKLAKTPPFVKYVVWAGVAFFVLGSLWMIGVAFYDSMGWGLVTFFLGLPGVILYFILHPKETWVPFALYIFGLLMIFIPYGIFGLTPFDFLF